MYTKVIAEKNIAFVTVIIYKVFFRQSYMQCIQSLTFIKVSSFIFISVFFLEVPVVIKYVCTKPYPVRGSHSILHILQFSAYLVVDISASYMFGYQKLDFFFSVIVIRWLVYCDSCHISEFILIVKIGISLCDANI